MSSKVILTLLLSCLGIVSLGLSSCQSKLATTNASKHNQHATQDAVFHEFKTQNANQLLLAR